MPARAHTSFFLASTRVLEVPDPRDIIRNLGHATV